MARKERVTITVDPEILKRIDRLASAKRQNRSAWFAEAIADAVDQDESAVKFFTDPLLRETFVKAFGQPGMLKAFSQAVGAELGDDQLKLFSDRLAGVLKEPGAMPGGVGGKKKGVKKQ